MSDFPNIPVQKYFPTACSRVFRHRSLDLLMPPISHPDDFAISGWDTSVIPPVGILTAKLPSEEFLPLEGARLNKPIPTLPVEAEAVDSEVVWDIIVGRTNTGTTELGRRFYYAHEVIDNDPRPFAPKVHSRSSCMPSHAKFARGRVIDGSGKTK
jgi:hypothetical protein